MGTRWAAPVRAGRLSAAVLAGVTCLAGCTGPPPTGPTGAGPTGDGLPRPVVAGCPAGSDPDRPGPPGRPRPDLGAVPVSATMDPQAGLVVLVEPLSRATWGFDVCTNSWRALAAGPQPALAVWARLAYDPPTGQVVALDLSDPVPWTYSATTDRWTRRPVAAGTPTQPLTDVTYDSARNVVVVWSDRGRRLWTYDVAANTWTAQAPSPVRTTRRSLLTYDAGADRVVLIRPDLPGWSYDPATQEWIAGAALGPPLNTGWVESGGEATYDPGTGQVLVFSDTVLATYDTRADRWKRRLPGPGWPPIPLVAGASTGPLARLGHTLVHDPINDRVLLIGGMVRTQQGTGWRPADDVWAYSARTDSWTRLLAPRPG